MSKIVRFDPNIRKRNKETGEEKNSGIRFEGYDKPNDCFHGIRYFAMGAIATVIGSDINIAGMDIIYDASFYMLILSFFYLWLGVRDE